nr:hypothetical protein [Deltaproteobacteria bacterium]
MGIISTSHRVVPSAPSPTAPASMPAPLVRDPMPVPTSKLSQVSSTAASDTLFDEDPPEMEPAQVVQAAAPYSPDLGLMNPAETDWASGVPPVPTTKFTGDGTATLLGTNEPDGPPPASRRALSRGAGAATIQYGDERAPLDDGALDSPGPLLATRQIPLPGRAAPSGADVATIGFTPDALEAAALRGPSIQPHPAPVAPLRGNDAAAATLELLPTPALAVPPGAPRSSMAPGVSSPTSGISGPTVVAIALGLMVLFGALGWFMGTSGTGH